MVSLAAAVICAFIILGVVISRPTMVPLVSCDSAQQASTVQTLLSDNNISFETSQDGMSFYVSDKDEAQANILLGSNDIPTAGYTLDDVIDGSFSTTEADKQKRYQLYMESRFEDYIETLSMIEEANITLSLPERDGTLIAQQQDAYASVILTLSSPISEDTAFTIAKYIATELGNDDTANITIMSSDGNMIFSGGDTATVAGAASANQSIKEKVKNNISKEVKDVILETNVYDNVEVAINLNMSFDKDGYVDYHYYVDEGQTQGYLDSYSGSNSTSTSGAGGVPGTDSNDDDTTYVTDDGTATENSSEELVYDYLPSETITTHEGEVGVIQYEDSSISVACTTYAIYKEEDLEKSGQLDELGMTFDEFVAANSERVQKDVTEDMVSLVANATGFSTSNITIVAYEIPMFQYKQGSGRTITDYLMILLAVLIFAMLGFVVFRSMRPDSEEPVEEELTIDNLIASTQEEEELEDIGYVEKSEARLLIEKFVDEKPEAVAQLLRNWLNEDWG